MNRVKDGNYIVIQSFMVKDLHLKGNELLIYAIIYGFSQDEQAFTGSIQYLADWANCSRHTVIDNLKSLCDKNLISKHEVERSGVKFCEYRSRKWTTSAESSLPSAESSLGGSAISSLGGSAETAPNNISIYNLSTNNLSNKDRSKPIRHQYGEYSNVLLTDDDLEKLKSEFPSDWSERIDRLSSYMESTGKHYKNHLATIRNWARNDKGKEKVDEQRKAGLGTSGLGKIGTWL